MSRRRGTVSGPPSKIMSENLVAGTVVQAMGFRWDVRSDNALYRCSIRRTVLDAVGAPVVGDRVWLEPGQPGTARIAAIQPRRTVIRRADVHRGIQDQVIVSNVDQALIVGSIHSPSLNPGLIDRYLVAVWKEGITPVLCLTKWDLEPEDSLHEILDAYQVLNIRRVDTSIVDQRGIEEVLDLVTGKTSVLLGPSGVGKTALARKLVNDQSLVVGEINEATGRGRHTTTSARYLDLVEGREGALIDLPGQRVFGLTGLTLTDLKRGFPEIEALDPCLLPQCTHEEEPGCEIEQALEDGRVSVRRLEAYLRILFSLGL